MRPSIIYTWLIAAAASASPFRPSCLPECPSGWGSNCIDELPGFCCPGSVTAYTDSGVVFCCIGGDGYEPVSGSGSNSDFWDALDELAQCKNGTAIRIEQGSDTYTSKVEAALASSLSAAGKTAGSFGDGDYYENVGAVHILGGTDAPSMTGAEEGGDFPVASATPTGLEVGDTVSGDAGEKVTSLAAASATPRVSESGSTSFSADEKSSSSAAPESQTVSESATVSTSSVQNPAETSSVEDDDDDSSSSAAAALVAGFSGLVAGLVAAGVVIVGEMV